MPASGWRGGVSSARAARCVWSSQGNHKSVSRAHPPAALPLPAALAPARRTGCRPGRLPARPGCGRAPVAGAGRCRPGRKDQPGGVPAGQLIRMLSPSPFRDTWTSSASPAITARPSCAGSAAGSWPSGPLAGSGGHAMPSSPTAAVLVTTTSNRSRAPVSATRTGSPGQYSWCTSTAREQASPTASLTSSSSASGTPLRRATAVATSRAVRTCAGSGVNVISTVAIVWDGAASLLRLPGGYGLVHAVVDAEDLRQPGDPKDLQDALLGAHQVERAVVGTNALEPADEHAQAGGVEKLHLLHVHHQLVVTTVHKIDKKLTQPRGGIDIDLALDIDDLDPVRRVMLQFQVHKSSRAMRSSCRRLRWRPCPVPPRGTGTPPRIQSRADVMSTRVHASRHPARGTACRLLPGVQVMTAGHGVVAEGRGQRRRASRRSAPRSPCPGPWPAAPPLCPLSHHRAIRPAPPGAATNGPQARRHRPVAPPFPPRPCGGNR